MRPPAKYSGDIVALHRLRAAGIEGLLVFIYCAWETGYIGYIVHNQVINRLHLRKQTGYRPVTFWPSIQRKGAKAQSRDRKRQNGRGIKRMH